MEAAVARAVADAQEGDVVLLAPAAASFDQYDSFEKRGDDFIARVKDATRSWIKMRRDLRNRLSCSPSRRPRPLKVIPAQPAGYIDTFTDEIEARHGFGGHRFR